MDFLAGDDASGRLAACSRAAAVLIVVINGTAVICSHWAVGSRTVTIGIRKLLSSWASAVVSFWSNGATVPFPRAVAILCFILTRSTFLIFGGRATSLTWTAFVERWAAGSSLGVGWAIYPRASGNIVPIDATLPFRWCW